MSIFIAARSAANEDSAGFAQSLTWYGLGFALAAAIGGAIGLGGKLMLAFAFGATGGLLLLFAPIQLVVAVFLFVTFLVVGPLTSIANIQQASWVPYLFGLILLIRVPMERYHSSKGGYANPSRNAPQTSPVMWAIGCYFAAMAFSVFSNFPPPLQVLIGAKLYLFIWGVFFLLVVSSVSPEFLERMWKGILLVAVLQFPFALYQRVFEVGRRAKQDASVNVLDAIVGTFPGTEGGGANAALVVLCIFAIALAISLRRNKLLSAPTTWVVVLACLASIALGEVKAIIVFIPLAFLVLNRREVLRRPLFFLGVGILVVSLVAGVFSVYQNASIKGRDRSLWEHVEASFEYVFDPNYLRENGEVGRFAALVLWHRDGLRTPQNFLVGYGPAASQASTMARGDVASRYYPLGVNGHTAAALLWDIGVAGLASFIALVSAGFFQALKLSGSAHVPPFHRSVLEACAVLFALVGVSIPYSGDWMFVPQYQVLTLLALAQVVYWHSKGRTLNCSTTE